MRAKKASNVGSKKPNLDPNMRAKKASNVGPKKPHLNPNMRAKRPRTWDPRNLTRRLPSDRAEGQKGSRSRAENLCTTSRVIDRAGVLSHSGAYQQSSL